VQWCAALTARPGPHKNILIIGDSLQRLFTTSLAAAFDATQFTPSPSSALARLTNGTPSTYWDAWTACEGLVSIVWLRNDWLEVDGTRSPKNVTCGPLARKAQINVCMSWADRELLAGFGIVVLNTGPHAQPPGWLERNLRASAAFVRAATPPGAIAVFRTSVPGHSHCEATARSTPFASVADAERAVTDDPW
jgi:hypothetical protein